MKVRIPKADKTVTRLYNSRVKLDSYPYDEVEMSKEEFDNL